MSRSPPLQSNDWDQLRDELTLYPGPQSNEGEPSWSLHDPVRNLYFRIDWLTFEILCRWQLANADRIVEALQQETTLRIDTQAIEAVAEFVRKQELTKHRSEQDSRRMVEATERRNRSWLVRLLHHYLFFRVPLLRPDRWLGSTLPWVRSFASRSFVWLTLMALGFGLFEVSRQWDTFTATLVDLFSLQGLMAYLVTLVLVKFLHELGHAYTAKALGCRVPTIGIAFLVMFPMAYTDVNDAWKLPRKKDRLAVGAAGIVTELVIAAWATLLWGLLPDGVGRNVAFMLATTTWISTLLINASPFLRFDGYFLLMDSLDLPNLHQRSFALARWKLREQLFALGDPVPEYFSGLKRRLLILFAWGTWGYRLIVFIGIAILVYMMFPKPLGPLLAALEISWFILRPLWHEISVWNERRHEIMTSRRSGLLALVLVGVLLMVVLPWDTRVTIQALLQPAVKTLLVAPGAAVINRLEVSDNSPVESAQQLIVLTSPELHYQLLATQSRAQALQWQAGLSGINRELQHQQPVIRAEQQKVAAEIQGLAAMQQEYTLLAPHNGVIYWQNPDIKNGLWVAKNELLGQLVKMDSWQVHGYLTGHELDRVQVGDQARFFSESGRIEPLTLTVSSIASDASRVIDEAVLTSTTGGEMLVREQAGQLVPELAVYRVSLELSLSDRLLLESERLPDLRGHVVISGKARAWGWHYWRSAVAIVRREAGF